MRKLIYLLLAAAVFFLAGVYQSEIFMILFLAEGMLFLLFFFCPDGEQEMWRRRS